jgi:serine/threonine protein kinase
MVFLSFGEHENLLALVGVCTDFVRVNGRPIPAIVTELHQGSLKDAVFRRQAASSTRTGRFTTLDSLVLVLYDIARGLEHLHSRNFIHGDVALRNVLLADRNLGMDAKEGTTQRAARSGADHVVALNQNRMPTCGPFCVTLGLPCPKGA